MDDWEAVRQEVRITELIKSFRKHFLLIEDEDEYLKYFGPKKTLLDYEHSGNFHQQLGQHLLLEKREPPEAWWVRQKFSDDHRNIRQNLYKAVQEHSMRAFFSRRFKPGDRVLDIGCGTGFYANLIAETGATVLGIDPNENYIKLARNNAKNGASFELCEIGKPGAMDKIPDNSADYIFISDALLFYFVPFDPRYKGDIDRLFEDIGRILRPSGIFINVEPNYIFWLLPWLGEVDRPFTIMTEYSKKVYGVTPTISQLIQAYSKGKFLVASMEELYPDPSFALIDARAYNFGKQFPLWQLFELRKIPSETAGTL